ncbi:hypothetical protein [Ancylomarina longa]|uniref:Uncharacterized protein n=1 Tax=Ancylomarina longa TaxID=2487017 RepID=A0A434AFV3_9BACT|nr:hypothetical protein [Ancylomarina longa]RUT73259.1 hypothetical protein DLK05_14365 [Ancylomarina longa]
MKKPNIALSIGLLIFAAIQLLKHLFHFELPDFWYGFVVGLSLVLMVTGLLGGASLCERLRAGKRNIFGIREK